MAGVFQATAAYFIGCIPVSRYVQQATADKPWSKAAVSGVDFLKGLFVMLLLTYVGMGSVSEALVLTALVAGEQWPALGASRNRLGFWVAAGGMTAVTPVAPLVWLVLWGIGFAISGYFVIGRITGLALTWLVLGFVAGWPIGFIAMPASAMILERSRDDLDRVRTGEVPKHHWRDET